MMQSQPFRSASLCHRYWRCAPSTWSITQPQSRSDHVPGNTTTPNLIRVPSSAAVPVRFDVEPEILDHVVGQQLAAHRLDALARLVLAGGFQVDLDVLAHAHV